MHELSIALSLLEEVGSAAAREKATRIASVRLRLGALCGVARDALLFAWEIARADTLAAEAELQIENVPVALYCPACRTERAPLQGGGFRCGTCGASAPTVVRGRELELVTMEVV